jgi:hypothetical protein
VETHVGDDSVEVEVQYIICHVNPEGLLDVRGSLHIHLVDPAEERGYTHCPALTFSLRRMLILKKFGSALTLLPHFITRQ